MRLYFMRHAHALEPAKWDGEEGARPLLPSGRRRAEAAARGLATLRPGIGAIVSSPYARAYETALIVGRVLGAPVVTDDTLAPDVDETRFDLARLDHALSLRPDADGTLLVAHEPDLSELITLLVAPGERPAEGVVMKKASCCLLETPDDLPGGASVVELKGRCVLAWLRGWRELAALAQ